MSLAAYPNERKNAEVPHGNAVDFNTLVGTFTHFLVYRKVHTQGRSVINVITDNELDRGVLALFYHSRQKIFETSSLCGETLKLR